MRVNELFEPANRAERIELARTRRAAKRERRLSLRSEGQTVENVSGQAWEQVTADYFEVQPEQPGLF